MRSVSKFVPPALALLCLSVLLYTQLRFPQAFEAQRMRAFDGWMSLFPAIHKAPEATPAAIIDIDEQSLSSYGPWPWPAETMAALIHALNAAGAAIVALALIPERTNADAPTASGESLSKVPASNSEQPPVVIGFALTDSGGSAEPPPRYAGLTTIGAPWPLQTALPATLLPGASAQRDAAGLGALNIFPDQDGRLRRLPLLVQMRNGLYPSLLSEMLRVGTGQTAYLVRFGTDRARVGTGVDRLSLKIGPQVVPLDADGQFWLHYARRADFPRQSAAAVIAGAAATGTLAGKAAVVGVSAPGIGARFNSPLGESLAPAEIYAQAFAQLLAGNHPVRPPWALGAEAAVGALGALALILLSLRRRGLWLVIPGLLLAAGVVGTALLLFQHGLLLLDPALPALSIGSVLAVLTLGGYVIEVRQRAWLQKAFASYVSPNLVQHLIRHPEDLRLTGERRTCSFVMTDLAGFTPMVESMPPEELVDLLNRYLAGIVELVFRHDGTVEQIVGDAVAVIFSAPLDQPDHARRAVALALQIDHFATTFSRQLQQQSVPFGITRIGVHTGEVLVGNFGGRDHINYRALGDPINTAARLESANRHFGTRIAISSETLSQCPDVATRPIGELLLKGKSRPVPACTPLSSWDIESGLAAAYTRAYDLAEQEDAEAAAEFDACAARFPDDGLTRFHQQRLRTRQRGVRVSLEK